MAFSADELRVLRRALAEALLTAPSAALAERASAEMPRSRSAAPPVESARRAVRPSTAHAPTGTAREPGDVHEYLRLAEALDEAVRESDRLRSFLRADLARYREALPGTAADYLELLGEALDGGYLPTPEDLAALRELRRLPCGPAESYRREGMRRRCEDLAELAVRARLDRRTPRPRPAEWGPARPADRKGLLALPGGRCEGGGPGGRVLDVLIPVPASGSARPASDSGPIAEPPQPPQSPEPERRVPTPAEIWPPRRRDTAPPQERRAIG
ncbi:hypothetical protein GCM10009753_62250 [Streptantibioticus ferralitis]